jgi:hypothetical protein
MVARSYLSLIRALNQAHRAIYLRVSGRTQDTKSQQNALIPENHRFRIPDDCH